MDGSRAKICLLLAVVYITTQDTDSKELIIRRHLNPEGFMNVNEILHYWGYPSEEYEILTEDGYYLRADRIPHGLHSPVKTGPKPVVLLLCGLVIESREFISSLPTNSLGFVLADAGYDVWILNNRGSSWSRKHQNLTVDQEEFWNFSFHEMAVYDVPATINFILQKTQQEALYVIGHSQGGSLGLITFSVLPQLAKKIKLFFCFAPSYTLVGMKGPTSILLNLPESLIKSRADVYVGIYPDYSSVKTIIHWGQVVKSNEFKHFDYGEKNKAMYNMTSPPFYKIEDMTVPTAVWSGGRDIIERQTDIELLLPRISNLVSYKHIPSWQHMDFIWGMDAPECLYSDMLDLMQKFK